MKDDHKQGIEERGFFAGLFSWPVVVFCVVMAGAVLTCVRSAAADETYYLCEANEMAECLLRLKWFGNEAVGLHGFLFKLPAALLFMIFGPSVFLATLSTVILAGVSCWLCVRVFRKVLNVEDWATVGAAIVMTNFHCVLATPTFLREIPALFASLVFLDSILSRRSKWAIGLSLLLILDAKEYAFFIIFPAFVLWVPIDEWMTRAERSLGEVLISVIERWLAGLLPAVAYIILMLFTGVIPLNMYIPYIFGWLDKGGGQLNLRQFSVGPATANLMMDGRTISSVPATGKNEMTEAVVCCFNTIIRYVGKLLYPRTFSFIAIPRVSILPAVVMSVRLYRKWWCERNGARIFLPLMFWVYLLVYVARSSHGRYLVPVLPLAALFLAEFLRSGLKERTWSTRVILLTTLFVGFGLYFEQSYVSIKMIINIVILLGMLFVAVIAEKSPRRAEFLSKYVALSICFSSLTVAIASSLLLHGGQIGTFIRFGYNSECSKIAREFNPQESIWVNKIGWGYLLAFYRPQRFETPEFLWPEWTLRTWIPKKWILHRYDKKLTYDFSREEVANFRREIEERDIRSLGLVVSEVAGIKFSEQDFLGGLQNTEWLSLEKIVPLKNKKLYIFRVIRQDQSSSE